MRFRGAKSPKTQNAYMRFCEEYRGEHPELNLLPVPKQGKKLGKEWELYKINNGII